MALTEQQRARRETNRRAALQRRIKLGLGRGLALTTFDLTGRTPTFVLDALPAERFAAAADAAALGGFEVRCAAVSCKIGDKTTEYALKGEPG